MCFLLWEEFDLHLSHLILRIPWEVVLPFMFKDMNYPMSHQAITSIKDLIRYCGSKVLTFKHYLFSSFNAGWVSKNVGNPKRLLTWEDGWFIESINTWDLLNLIFMKVLLFHPYCIRKRILKRCHHFQHFIWGLMMRLGILVESKKLINKKWVITLVPSPFLGINKFRWTAS